MKEKEVAIGFILGETIYGIIIILIGLFTWNYLPVVSKFTDIKLTFWDVVQIYILVKVFSGKAYFKLNKK